MRDKNHGKWLRKFYFDLKLPDNSKNYAFHNDYGHLTANCWQLKWEIQYLINKGQFKEFMSSQWGSNNNHSKDERRKNKRNRGNSKSTVEKMEKRCNGNNSHTINGVSIDGGETMDTGNRHIKQAKVTIATKNRHLKQVEVTSVRREKP